MFDQPVIHRPAPDMTYEQMLQAVQYEGAYADPGRTAEAVRRVLAALGRQLTGRERADLAARLPMEAAVSLTAQIPEFDRLTGWGFVKDLAARTGTSPATARWDTGAVLAVVARLAGPELLARILKSLPDGYALLFGQIDLTAARAS
ncbi:DUF2267 domain-containing protein [Streptomyces sp. BR123]|uniref:DUF2267 domain-containing protein n=1 Tax=Streptomyces sp. BR123 TaxID=2749828 RepID=UPI0015C49857|nr:DUF2267 domain-containing protein [Streptomyces sp. BR123]NXY94032.1 DUF2267 domain-containing protein [Streptomyces sp. BR123]